MGPDVTGAPVDGGGPGLAAPRSTAGARSTVGPGAAKLVAVTGPGERFWPTELDESERSVVQDGRGSFDARPDVLVVGGGILGVLTAWACTTAGLGAVQLVEAAQLGDGATGGSAGLLQPEPHQGSDPDSLVDVARRSLTRWKELEEVIPGGVGLVEHDWIGLAPHPEAFAADPPPTARWLEAPDVARLVPGLAAPVPGVLIPRQARLNPLRALARVARRLPAVATGVRAIGLTRSGSRVSAVTTTAETIHPGAVVFATGSPPDLAGLPLPIPTDLVKGHLLVTEPAGVPLAGTVAPVATGIGGGRLLTGGTLDLDDRSPDVQDHVIARLHRELAAAVPAAADLAVSHAWCCWRPRHPDALPVIDRVPGTDNAWITSGHYRTGVLMAPATAEVLAEWLRTGQRPDVAAPFTAARFAR